jgi:hypothetical protein
MTDLQDRPTEGLFYNYELVKVTVSPQFEIDKIVRSRNEGIIKQQRIRRNIQLICKRYRYQVNILEHFYVTLPSGSSSYYIQANTIADFRPKLAKPLELQHDKREVGLVEITFPKLYRKRSAQHTSFTYGGIHISCKTP